MWKLLKIRVLRRGFVRRGVGISRSSVTRAGVLVNNDLLEGNSNGCGGGWSDGAAIRMRGGFVGEFGVGLAVEVLRGPSDGSG